MTTTNHRDLYTDIKFEQYLYNLHHTIQLPSNIKIHSTYTKDVIKEEHIFKLVEEVETEENYKKTCYLRNFIYIENR